MNNIAKFIEFVNRVNDVIGRAVSWLTLGMVLVALAVVVLRYVFEIGYVWMQESYVWMHGLVFMIGAGYTLLHDGHVRVDIFYAKASARRQAWVNLLGTLFLLLPMLGVICWTSWGYVLDSWSKSESSYQAGGLPAVYLLKTAILVFCGLVFLQALSIMARSVLVLKGYGDD